jgi:two-component system sensor histidine kinase UhpB
VAVCEDITARKQAQDKLQRSAEELRLLSARLAESQETERASLSKELHDRVGQNLTALDINLSILESQLPADGAQSLRSRLEDSQALLQDTARRIRDVMAELRPPLLDQYGLVTALHAWAGAFAQRTGIAARGSAERSELRASAAVETALFRIAQEALNNIAKHAAARNVEICVEPADGGRRLTVRDDGRGFDVAALEAPGRPPSWGMITMRERAQAVGGSLRVESAPGRGTSVIADIPEG